MAKRTVTRNHEVEVGLKETVEQEFLSWQRDLFTLESLRRWLSEVGLEVDLEEIARVLTDLILEEKIKIAIDPIHQVIHFDQTDK